MPLTVIGEHPLTTDERGALTCRIATLFVRTATLVTLPGVHATQRVAYVDRLNADRRAAGLPALTPDEECREWEDAVDLIMDGNVIQIRPDPGNLPQAFEADRLLQELPGLSKRNIRFLYARHEGVQRAIRRRGEYWRITPLPQSPREIVAMIARARIAIAGQPIYYYSTVTGTRHLTFQQFAALGAMHDDDLRKHLAEIAEFARRDNHIGHPELVPFATRGTFRRAQFGAFNVHGASPDALRAWHAEMTEQFRQAVNPELREDALDNLTWRNLMFSTLTGQRDETVSDEVLQGVNPEFFMQIRWLPGGRIEHGELMFDPVFAERDMDPSDRKLDELCDENVKAIIFNYVREFGNLEYVNIGRVEPTLRRHARVGGHRAYIAEVKHRAGSKPVVRIIRLQKWGIREHIESQKDLLTAIMEAEDYTEYILDRRLGCWQLGMPLPPRIITRRIAETYRGSAERYHGTRIWTTYFERDYIEGVATDKVPVSRYRDESFALAFVRLLGQAAAPNMVVGRTSPQGHVLFDSGDEVLVMDADRMPLQIIVADHAGTFTDFESPLDRFAPEYARPVLSRLKWVLDPQPLIEAYVTAFSQRLCDIQNEYRSQRRAFDTLFKHSKQEPGAFAWRWRKVLQRLEQTDMPALAGMLRQLCRR